MTPLSTTLYLFTILLVCWALALGLTWAPCYAQVCPERYHQLGTRMHTIAYYALLASVLFALLIRASSSSCRTFSQHHLTPRDVPILRKRISVGGLLFGLVIAGALATTAFWMKPLTKYWTARFEPSGWRNQVPQLVLTGIFAHHADILLGLLLIPVGRNSLLVRAFRLHFPTLLFVHKLLAYLTVSAVLAHGVTYYISRCKALVLLGYRALLTVARPSLPAGSWYHGQNPERSLPSTLREPKHFVDGGRGAWVLLLGLTLH